MHGFSYFQRWDQVVQNDESVGNKVNSLERTAHNKMILGYVSLFFTVVATMVSR